MFRIPSIAILRGVTNFGVLPPDPEDIRSVGDWIDITRFYQGVPTPLSGQGCTWVAETFTLFCASIDFRLRGNGAYVLLSTGDPIDWENAWLGQITWNVPTNNRTVEVRKWEATNLTDSLGCPPTGTYTMWYGPIKFASAAQMTLSPVYIGQYGLRFLNSISGTVSNMLVLDCTQESNIPIGIGGGTCLNLTSTEADKIQIFRLDLDIATAQIYRDTKKTLDTNTPNLVWEEHEPFEDDADIWSRNGNYPPVDDDGNRVRLHSLSFYGSRLWGAWENRLYYSQAFDTVNSFEYFGLAGLNYQEFPDTIRSVVYSETSITVFLEFNAVSASYFVRGYPFNPMVFRWVDQENRKKGFQIASYRGYKRFIDDDGVMRNGVAGVGCGCTLFRVEDFKRVPYPWFQTGLHHTEDAFWFDRAHKVIEGYKVGMDFNIKCGHLCNPAYVDASNVDVMRKLHKQLHKTGGLSQ